MRMRVTVGPGSGQCWTLTEAWSQRLAGVVDTMWCFEGVPPDGGEHHLPNGLLEIVVAASGAITMAGLQTTRTSMLSPRRPTGRTLGIRLLPLGAHRLLRTSHETTGHVVVLEDLIGPDANALAGECLSASTPVACLVRAKDWLCERLAAAPSASPAVDFVVTTIRKHHGAVSIRHLEEQLGMSPKRLLQLYKNQVGITPKLYARLMRFHRALVLLHQATSSLAEVSLEAGYYDQPHMHLDFVRFAHMTPGAFVKARRHLATTIASP